MIRKDIKITVRLLSSVLSNLSSGWFALIVIAPNYWPLKEIKDIITLIEDMIFGIIFLLFAFFLEKNI